MTETPLQELERLRQKFRQNIQELDNFIKITVHRENTMIGLKREINDLNAEMGRPAPYDVV